MRSGKQTASHATSVRGLISRVVILAIVTATATTASAGCERAIMPDLIIESVSCSHARPSSDMGPGVELDFTIRIKNIGNAASSGKLYIKNTKSNEDLNMNHYSHSGLVKYDEPSIAPSEVLEVKITDYVDEDVKIVRFMVNPEFERLPPAAIEDGVEYPVTPKRLEESNYKNNTYELELPADIPAYKPPEREEDKIIITKYTTTSTQYLATGEPVKYTFEEISQVIRIRNNLSEEAKQCCLTKVLDYIYTFPRYKYEEFSGKAWPGNIYNERANVVISVDARGLSSGTIATEIGEDYGDSNHFELRYNEATEECELLSYHFINWIISKEVYDNAVLLAMEDPVVQDFIEDSEGYDLHFKEWIDGFKGKGTNWAASLGEINFKKPIKGIVILRLENTRYSGLWVYVDMFYGEVFTQGPIDFSPQ